jgi:hypothetical protein
MTASIIISTNKAKQILTPGQKKFNKLIKRLQQQQKLLQQWQRALDNTRVRYTDDIEPCSTLLNESRVELLLYLDKAYEQKELSLLQLKKLQAFIVQFSLELIHVKDNEQIKAIHDKHSEMGIEEKNKIAAKHFKSEIEAMYDIDLGDDFDPESEDFMEKLRQEYNEQKKTEQPRQKTKKQLEKETKEEAAEKAISQSVRDVFRQLAKSLHPDREMDTQERERKSELMQKVNVAYKDQDLLTLLTLQLEIEQINQDNVDNIAEAPLAHYNKVLTKQCAEIKNEILMLKDQLCTQFDLPSSCLQKPNDVNPLVDEKVEHLEQARQELEDEMVNLQVLRRFKKFINGIDLRQLASGDDWG